MISYKGNSEFPLFCAQKYSLAVIASRYDIAQNSGGMDVRMTGHKNETIKLITLGKSDTEIFLPCGPLAG